MRQNVCYRKPGFAGVAQPFNLKLDLLASAYAQASATRQHGANPDLDSNSATAEFDFGNSVYWNGLSSVTANGNPLTPGDYSATGANGLDYTLSFVPEPGQYGVVAGVSLLGLALWHRRRGRSLAGG